MKSYRGSERIARVETTQETLTGRGGLALFARYLSQVGVYGLLDGHFGKLRKSAKGLPIWNLFMQVFCFLMDGTSRHLSYFDQLAQDRGYAAMLENRLEQMASSHTIKRFFQSFGVFSSGWFRRILHRLFVWRLRREQPGVVELTIDTMVMDNDEAARRQGVEPTYKKVKGFQPLQMIWNGKIVDAVFRSGKTHSNAGNAVEKMIRKVAPLIRSACGDQVLIVLRLDSGFFDHRLLEVCTQLRIGCILSGKMYGTIKDYVKDASSTADWQTYDNGRQHWEILEFGWRCQSWPRYYRAFYTRPIDENRQLLFDFARPDNVVLTHLGVDPEVLADQDAAVAEHWLSAETILASHHQRGADELPHRGLKDFGFEQLPFHKFHANAAFYYCLLIAFFLHETFKEDVLAGVVSATSYATTVRRRVIDIAAKVIRKAHQVIMKVTQATMDSISFDQLWNRCQSPPKIEPAVA